MSKWAVLSRLCTRTAATTVPSPSLSLALSFSSSSSSPSLPSSSASAAFATKMRKSALSHSAGYRAKDPSTITLITKRRTTNGPSRKHYHERRLLKFSCDQLYDVVSDVQSYNKFVPWCKESTVLKSTPEALEAELVVGFGFFKEKYISEVTMVRPSKVIAESKETNLLEFLRTEWRFTPNSSDPRKCWVTFQIEFKFRSTIYNQVSDMFLQDVIDKMVHAFETRCKKVYAASDASSRNSGGGGSGHSNSKQPTTIDGAKESVAV